MAPSLAQPHILQTLHDYHRSQVCAKLGAMLAKTLGHANAAAWGALTVSAQLHVAEP